MQIIRLPRQFPGELDLVALNKRLQAGEVRLDWTHVASDIRPEHLETILNGLNLAEHVEIIGGETIPKSLIPLIQDAFQKVEDHANHHDNPDAPDVPFVNIAPALWTPPEETAIEQDEEIHEEILPPPPPAATVPEQAAEHTPILVPPSQAAMREELETMVLRDLLGPVGGEEEEVGEDRVRDRYLVGMLAPNKVQTVPEEQDEIGIAEGGSAEDGPADVDVLQKASLNPSSIGMSFCVDKDATSLLVTVRWGQYKRQDSQTQMKANGVPKKIFRRRQRGGEPKLFPLQEGAIEIWRPEPEEQPDVFVKGIMRRSHDNWTVTLFLVNGQREPKRLRDEVWLFQPEMIVEAPGGRPIFQQRLSDRRKYTSPEGRAMAMLYRRSVSFAVGHGISVHAETMPGDPTCAVRLVTHVVPSYDVPLTQAPTVEELPTLRDMVLDMKILAEADTTTLLEKLQPLAMAYAAWIDEQEQRIDDPAAGLRGYEDVARQTLQQCRATLARIREGLNSLIISSEAVRAFTFMNRAMWQQRIHTLHAEEKRQGNARTLADIDRPENRSWRPFQLAFILLNLPSLTDLHHPDRREDPGAIADLLWFPTGGGKTEAYLGLTAYTLAIRRLQGTIEGRSGQDGVAVIMRYTLRLLTLQQFQRASSLICACEIIRREDENTWGKTPFRLGLWVGQRSTPNTTEESEQAIKEDHGMYGSNFAGVGSPRQLTNCPWCGSPIEGGKNIVVESVNKERGRTLIYCSDPYGQCAFSKAKARDEGLPVLVVDEEIYRLLPALLIATVDKFAQLPWKGTTQMLFGQVDKYCSRHGFRSPDLDDSDLHKASGRWPATRSIAQAPLRPPDLIIQDELHLISGPLGTLVGLYETVIDHLATWEVGGQNVRPKVIAATATIRQAGQQIHDLFLRTVNIFPPQGLDVEDNSLSPTESLF